MPKTYKRPRPSKGRKKYVKKTKRFTKKTAKRYIPGRTMAIQRATFTPQTRLIEFVMDETFYLVSAAGGKSNTSFGIGMKLSNPYAPFDFVGGGPFWGACNTAKCARLSGKTTAYNAYSVPGLGRWVGYHPSPYKKATVIGFDTEIRADQATRSVSQSSPAGAADYVREIALCAKLSKDVGTADQSTTSDATLAQWQGCRKMRQVNMTTFSTENDRTAGATKPGTHQAYIRIKGSPKKMHGIAQYKDNPEFSFEYDDTGASNTLRAPETESYLHIGVFDRYRWINNTSDQNGQAGVVPYVMPDMAIRVKTKFICLLSHVNNRLNVDMGTAVAAGAMAQ